MTSLNTFISNFFEAMWAGSEKEMAEGPVRGSLNLPTFSMVTARIWKAWRRMHLLVMCLAHSVDNEGANTDFYSWCAHLSSPAAAPVSTSSQGASQVA